MNPFQNVIDGLQTLMGQVPELVQPFIVALAGAIPFVEGEVASTLGVWAGVHPVIAWIAAVTGNFLSVLVVVVFGARIRAALVARRARKKAAALVAVGAGGTEIDDLEEAVAKPESKGRQRFRRMLVRFGVPGASILGPLALPTQFTSAILVSSGVSKNWVLLWQAIAIALWTTFTTVAATFVLSLI